MVILLVAFVLVTQAAIEVPIRRVPQRIPKKFPSDLLGAADGTVSELKNYGNVTSR